MKAASIGDYREASTAPPAALPFRIFRRRLRRRAHSAREHRGSAGHRITPARAERRLGDRPVDDAVRPANRRCPLRSARSGLPVWRRGAAKVQAARAAAAKGVPFTPVDRLRLLACRSRAGLSRRPSGSSSIWCATAASCGRCSTRRSAARAARFWCSPSTCRCPARAIATSASGLSGAANLRGQVRRVGQAMRRPRLGVGCRPPRPPAPARQCRAFARPQIGARRISSAG